MGIPGIGRQFRFLCVIGIKKFLVVKFFCSDVAPFGAALQIDADFTAFHLDRVCLQVMHFDVFYQLFYPGELAD